jgi:hypothetical protein
MGGQCTDTASIPAGDIVELTPSGAVKIIDRKKNIFKLAQVCWARRRRGPGAQYSINSNDCIAACQLERQAAAA